MSTHSKCPECKQWMSHSWVEEHSKEQCKEYKTIAETEPLERPEIDGRSEMEKLKSELERAQRIIKTLALAKMNENTMGMKALVSGVAEICVDYYEELER